MNRSRKIISVSANENGYVDCPSCDWRFALSDRSQWSGLYHRKCGQRLKVEGHQFDIEFCWVPIANMKSGESEIFRDGAKLYLLPPQWGDGYANIIVIGKGKGSSRYVKAVVNWKKLINIRIGKTYKSSLIARLCEYYDHTEKSEIYVKDSIQLLLERK